MAGAFKCDRCGQFFDLSKRCTVNIATSYFRSAEGPAIAYINIAVLSNPKDGICPDLCIPCYHMGIIEGVGELSKSWEAQA